MIIAGIMKGGENTITVTTEAKNDAIEALTACNENPSEVSTVSISLLNRLSIRPEINHKQ